MVLYGRLVFWFVVVTSSSAFLWSRVRSWEDGRQASRYGFRGSGSWQCQCDDWQLASSDISPTVSRQPDSRDQSWTTDSPIHTSIRVSESSRGRGASVYVLEQNIHREAAKSTESRCHTPPNQTLEYKRKNIYIMFLQKEKGYLQKNRSPFIG